MKKSILSLFLLGFSTFVFGNPFSLVNSSKNKYGVTVTNCQFDYDEENFCSDKNMKRFAKVMETREPNFVQGKLLYFYQGKGVFGENSYYLRLVVIDKKKKTVEPFYWGFMEAEKPVNEKGDRLEFKFNKTEPRFCVKGEIVAYRSSYGFYEYKEEYPEGFCFPYVGKEGDYAGFNGYWRY